MENLIDELMFAEERLAQFIQVSGNDLSDLGEAHLEKLEQDIKRLRTKIEWQEMIAKINENYALSF